MNKKEYRKTERRFCTNCGHRKVITKMHEVYIPLIRKQFWVCQTCINAFAPMPPLGVGENTFYDLKLDELY